MFLGVDGGGTKTALCLVSAQGRLAARIEAPSCYYVGEPEGTALVGRVLSVAVAEVCRAAGVTAAQIEHAFVGLPGYGEVSADQPALDAAPRLALGHGRYTCGNDMVAGWAGSLGAADGINVVSGTGSICYGERAGRQARVGGWGELFGDEGSAYWVGIRGLQAFSMMSDGRLPTGPLHGLVHDHLGVAADLDVLAVTLTQWHGDRRRVAGLSRVVSQAAEQGDQQAVRILDAAAVELVALVDAARRHLEYSPGEAVVVSYSGGVFAADRVRAQFLRQLAAAGAGYDVRDPLYPPVVGAALYAATLAGTPLDGAARERLRREAA